MGRAFIGGSFDVPFASAGVTLSRAVGAALMSLSTSVVALNAQLLRLVQLKRS